MFGFQREVDERNEDKNHAKLELHGNTFITPNIDN